MALVHSRFVLHRASWLVGASTPLRLPDPQLHMLLLAASPLELRHRCSWSTIVLAAELPSVETRDNGPRLGRPKEWVRTARASSHTASRES
jgi:hypothetical protein